MPTTRHKDIHTITCVQKIGDHLYPRIFAYWTKAEMKKHFDMLKNDSAFFLGDDAKDSLGLNNVEIQVATRAERRQELEYQRLVEREERNARRREQRAAAARPRPRREDGSRIRGRVIGPDGLWHFHDAPLWRTS